MRTISKKSLLANMAFVQFKDQKDPCVIERREELFEDLSNFRKGRHDRLISDAAIRGWVLHVPPSVPKRRGAMRFLHKYFLDKNKNTAPTSGEERFDYFKSIDAFLLALGAASEPSPGILATNSEFRGERQARSKSSPRIPNSISSDRLSAVAGIYQIIRPHAGEIDKYILEPMRIYFDPYINSSSIVMYSHNQLALDFVYKGFAQISRRYIFSLLQRQHENEPDLRSIRCVAMRVDLQKINPTHSKNNCISGIMLRGVKGDTTVNGPVAVPIVAIRIKDDSCNLEKPEFVYLHAKLRRVNAGSYVLIGEIDKSQKEIFDLCDRIMTAHKGAVRKRDIIEAMSPSKIEHIVAPNANTPDQYENVWKSELEKYFIRYDNQRLLKSNK